jgi:hypothetical protein
MSDTPENGNSTVGAVQDWIRKNEAAEVLIYLNVFICSGIVLGVLLFIYAMRPIFHEPTYLEKSNISAQLNQWLVYFAQIWGLLTIPVVKSWSTIRTIKHARWDFAFGVLIVLALISAFGIVTSANIVLACPPDKGINSDFAVAAFKYQMTSTVVYAIFSLTLWLLPGTPTTKPA